MTAAQLAKRLGVSPSAVSQFEKAEREEGITLRSLRDIAAGMDARLVYALVPSESLEAIIERQARRVAARRMERVWHSMLLEGQEISIEERERQIEDLTEELLSGNLRGLWREE